jgi:hypothetical protein
LANPFTTDEARRIAAKPLKARKYAAGTGNGQALAAMPTTAGARGIPEVGHPTSKAQNQ